MRSVSAVARSDHVNSGTVAATLIGLPSGLVHGTSVPSGSCVRLRSAPSAIDMPPP
jgi:hypothetical protein